MKEFNKYEKIGGNLKGLVTIEPNEQGQVGLTIPNLLTINNLTDNDEIENIDYSDGNLLLLKKDTGVYSLNIEKDEIIELEFWKTFDYSLTDFFNEYVLERIPKTQDLNITLSLYKEKNSESNAVFTKLPDEFIELALKITTDYFDETGFDELTPEEIKYAKILKLDKLNLLVKYYQSLFNFHSIIFLGFWTNDINLDSFQSDITYNFSKNVRFKINNKIYPLFLLTNPIVLLPLSKVPTTPYILNLDITLNNDFCNFVFDDLLPFDNQKLQNTTTKLLYQIKGKFNFTNITDTTVQNNINEAIATTISGVNPIAVMINRISQSFYILPDDPITIQITPKQYFLLLNEFPINLETGQIGNYQNIKIEVVSSILNNLEENQINE